MTQPSMLDLFDMTPSAGVPEVTGAGLPPAVVTEQVPPCQPVEPGASSPWPNAAAVRRMLMADTRPRLGYQITAEDAAGQGFASYTEAPAGTDDAVLWLRMLVQFPPADGWTGHAARSVPR